jgi:hypothetical protein
MQQSNRILVHTKNKATKLYFDEKQSSNAVSKQILKHVPQRSDQNELSEHCRKEGQKHGRREGQKCRSGEQD